MIMHPNGDVDVYSTEGPAVAILLGEHHHVDPRILHKHQVSLDRLLRYVAFHALHWNRHTGVSAVSKAAAALALGIDRRNIDRPHRAAIEAGLIVEVRPSAQGRAPLLAYPWWDGS